MATKNKIPTTLGDRIRAAIAASGMTREEVATKADLALDTIYKILAGNREPSAATLARICRALEVSADELLGLK